MATVTVYTQPGCPFCARALALLSRKGVAVNEINAPHGTPEREESIRRAGGRSSVPQVFAGDRHLGGCDDIHALDGRGELDNLLGLSGAAA